MKNKIGPPVEGDDFFGREKELEYAWSLIKKGHSIKLSAPRRVGKSSFAKKLLTFAEKEKWNTLEINLEEVRTEEHFVKIFIHEIEKQGWWSKLKADSKGVLNSITENLNISLEAFGAKGSLGFQSKKENVYDDLKKLLDHTKPTLIMVDEVTVMLNNILSNDPENGKKNVEFFSNWLRSFRQVSDTKIFWVFCSSVGIDNFTHQHKISHSYNDVKPFPIDAFSEETAKEFLIALSESENITMTEEITNYFLQKIGWFLPFYIQILFEKYNYFMKVNRCESCMETIDKAYNHLLDGTDFNTWDERLTGYADLEVYARMLLKNICQAKEGTEKLNLQNIIFSRVNDADKTEKITTDTLYMLRNDGYIVTNENNKYAFRSPLLRDFWFKRHVN